MGFAIEPGRVPRRRPAKAHGRWAARAGLKKWDG